MDGNDDDNNNDDENHHDQQQQVVDIDEDEEGDGDDESAASIVAADTMIVRSNRGTKLMSLLEQYDDCPLRTRNMIVRSNRRAKLMSLLDQYDACPSRTRNNIDDLVANLLSFFDQYDACPFRTRKNDVLVASRTRNNVDELVEELLDKAEDDVHQMLCDQTADPEHYRGLDINRDTLKEVKTIVRIFPNVLSKRKETIWDGNEDEDGVVREWINAEGDGEYPIQCCIMVYGFDYSNAFNLKAGPFIATLAQLGTELNQFRDEERGGLLSANSLGWGGYDVLQRFVHHGYDVYGEDVDIVHLQQLVQLREMCLLKKEDILDHNLVHTLCRQLRFSERRFRFLIEWDPTVLTQTDEHGYSPVHWVVKGPIQIFRSVFENGLIYYPQKKGISLLFKKNNYNQTPLQCGCMEMYERNEFMDVVEDTISTHYSEETPLNIVDALLTAAIDDTIHLDCVFFLLRRQPDVLIDLLLGSTTATTNNHNNISSDGDNGSDGNINDGTNDSDGGTGRHRDDNDGDHGGGDRDDNNYHDNSNHENGGKEDDDETQISNTDKDTDTDTDANENDRKRKRTGDVYK